MKKFLSLVLALVMAMSLVTISAGAADFDDSGDIQYKEAVDVISALGIVDGYSDGTFRPDGSLTRGAAAKIICNLILGPTTADALSASTAPFRDVPTTNTFAGYITYCSQQGIIVGRCADHILRDMRPFRLFVYADLEARIARCRAKGEDAARMSDEDLRQKILTIDKKRARYYRFYTDQNWGERASYDLCINTANINLKRLTGSLAALIQNVYWQ